MRRWTYEVGCLGVRSGVLARYVGSDSHRLESGTSSSGVNLASVWSSTVSVDLVKSHVDGTTWGDDWHGVSWNCEHGCGTSYDIVGSSSDCLSASIGVGTTESGRISLERVSARAITRSAVDNYLR